MPNARELAQQLADAVVECYSPNGEFNTYTAPMGLQELRALALQLQRAINQQRQREATQLLTSKFSRQ